MLHEPELLIDRQFKYLLSRDGAEFFFQLRRCLAVLQREPRIATLMEELRQEAVASDRQPKERDDREVVRLVELKRKFIALAPDADDSSTPEPEDLSFSTGWFGTFAAFDAIAEGRKKPWPGDDTRSDSLLRILSQKISTVRAPPGSTANVEALALDVGTLRDEHDYSMQESKADAVASPGLALVGLEAQEEEFDKRVERLIRESEQRNGCTPFVLKVSIRKFPVSNPEAP